MAFAHSASGTGTNQELLDLTRAAIAQVMATGQAYSMDGRSLTRASLPELIAAEKYFAAKVAAESSTAGMAYTVAEPKTVARE